MSSFQDQPEYDDELFTLARNDDYEGIFWVIARRKQVMGDYLNRVILPPGTQYEVRIVPKPKPREWEIVAVGGLQLADGYQLQRGERVRVREVLP